MDTKTYRIRMADGSEVELPGVVSARADGSGRHFEMADGDTVSFSDGQSVWAIPMTATVTPPPAPEEPAVEDEAAEGGK